MAVLVLYCYIIIIISQQVCAVSLNAGGATLDDPAI